MIFARIFYTFFQLFQLSSIPEGVAHLFAQFEVGTVDRIEDDRRYGMTGEEVRAEKRLDRAAGRWYNSVESYRLIHPERKMFG